VVGSFDGAHQASADEFEFQENNNAVAIQGIATMNSVYEGSHCSPMMVQCPQDDENTAAHESMEHIKDHSIVIENTKTISVQRNPTLLDIIGLADHSYVSVGSVLSVHQSDLSFNVIALDVDKVVHKEMNWQDFSLSDLIVFKKDTASSSRSMLHSDRHLDPSLSDVLAFDVAEVVDIQTDWPSYTDVVASRIGEPTVRKSRSNLQSRHPSLREISTELGITIEP